jgi:hypothetical protein
MAMSGEQFVEWLDRELEPPAKGNYRVALL